MGFNKELSKKILKGTEVLMLDHEVVENRLINKEKLIEIFLKLGSFVLKPVASGSSFGVKIFKPLMISIFSKDLKKIYLYIKIIKIYYLKNIFKEES